MFDKLISLSNPKSRAAEAFRTLRTNIQFSSVDKELKTIVVTSAQPSEGKSTIMVNLAVTFAQSGKKVILIDCDFRKPTVHKKFEISNIDGITSVLTQSKTLEECIRKTEFQNFSILTCGPIPPNPAELLSSNRMKNILRDLKSDFDVIFIDTPPVLAVTDAQILSAITDGVVFVTAYGQTEKYAITKAKELINKVGGKFIGVVLNKVPYKSHSYYYENNYYYDSYSKADN